MYYSVGFNYKTYLIWLEAALDLEQDPLHLLTVVLSSSTESPQDASNQLNITHNAFSVTVT